MARSGLGKGLASLIPTDMSDEIGESSLRHVDIAHVYPNRFQPRAHFNEETIAALADSITTVGIIQPIVVRETDDGYEILAGERRWKAAQRAGLTQLPVLIRNSDDRNTLEIAIIENVHRENLNPLEEAAAYRQLTDDFGLTQRQVASKIGCSRSAVANAIRLLGLPANVQRLIIDGRLSAGHGRAILLVKGDEKRQRLAEEIVRQSLSVREAENLAASVGDSEFSGDSGNKSGMTGASSETDQGILELEDILTTRLDAKVTVKIGRGARNRGKGKIIIQFSDLTDLERIYNTITPTP